MKRQPKTTNWSAYNKILEQKGSLNLWVDEAYIRQLNENAVKLPPSKGRPFTFPDGLIELLLMIRHAFHQPLRQTIGFAKSLLPQMGLTIELPHFATLSRRAKTLPVTLDLPKANGPVHLALDSTGLKVYGEGEWKTRQHGVGKRRTWRKMHVAVDVKTMEVHAVTLSTNDVHDSDKVEEMLDSVTTPIASVRGDGAYDMEKTYACIRQKTAKSTIPPREDAVIHSDNPNLAERNQVLRFINDKMAEGMTKEEARAAWKRESGYHQRSKVETHMFRFKNTFSGRLQARSIERQKTEILLKTKMLNRLTRIGLPKIQKIA
jgi:hypothetical protein